MLDRSDLLILFASRFSIRDSDLAEEFFGISTSTRAVAPATAFVDFREVDRAVEFEVFCSRVARLARFWLGVFVGFVFGAFVGLFFELDLAVFFETVDLDACNEAFAVEGVFACAVVPAWAFAVVWRRLICA